MAQQPVNREAAKASPTGAVLLLPVVPHVGETDTDTLTEIAGRPAVAEEEKKEAEEKEEEVEDEFGYSWSEFMFWGPIIRFTLLERTAFSCFGYFELKLL